MFGRSHIIASEKTYLVRVKSRENDQRSFEAKLTKVLAEFFQEKDVSDVWYNVNEIALKSGLILHNRSAILVLASLYPSKVNELAEKISEFADVEVELAKKDITSREQV